MPLYIDKVTKITKTIFIFSILFLIIVSLWPGSLIGYFFYQDWNAEPHLIKNPYGTSINHFIYYIYVSLLGFLIFLNTKNFKKIVYMMFFLSIFLEVLHIIIPNRAFEFEDLVLNILGVIVAYFLIKIYLLFRKI
tara:strand:- start:201 stop:605 length:405 start_codon:yes stop_codon:yes gene_type:complete